MSSKSKRDKPQRRADPPQHRPAAKDDPDSDASGLVAVQAEYYGPLPPPQMLEQYERIHPGTAQCIVQRFVDEAKHRQSIERSVVDSGVQRNAATADYARSGQRFAFILGLVGLLGGTTAAMFSPTETGQWVGGIIGGTTLAGLVSAFIVGRVKAPTPED